MKILISFQPRFIPLIKMLHAEKHEIYVLHPNFQKMLSDLDVPSKSLVEVLTDEMKIEAFLYSARILSEIERRKSTIPMSLDVPAREFMSKNVVAFMYQRVGDLSALVVACNFVAPDLIILHNDVEPVTRAVAEWAKVNDKPCLHIPHAVYLNTGRGPAGTDVHDVITASHIAVAGPYQREWYKERGISPKNIRETGLIQFDAITRMLILEKDRARTLFGLKPDLPTIVYASSWRQDTNLLGCHDGVEEFYTKFLEATKLLPGIQVIVKTHPNSGNIGWHIETAKKLNIPVFVCSAHLEVALQAADIIFSYGPSNVLMEASVVPGIKLMVSHGYDDDIDVIKTGDEATPEEIAKKIAGCFEKDYIDASRFRNKYCGNVDGNSVNRIFDFIKEITS